VIILNSNYFVKLEPTKIARIYLLGRQDTTSSYV